MKIFSLFATEIIASDEEAKLKDLAPVAYVILSLFSCKIPAVSAS